MYINTDLFGGQSSSSLNQNTGGIGNIKPIQSVTPKAGGSKELIVAPPTAGSKVLGGIGKTITGALDLLNKPSQLVERGLSPVLFGKGVTDYKTGLKTWGLSDTASTVGSILGSTILDPLNLLAIGPVAKLATKVVGAPLKFGSKLLTPTLKGLQESEKFIKLSEGVGKFMEPFGKIGGQITKNFIVPGARLFRGSEAGEKLLTKLRKVEDITKSFSGPLVYKIDDITRGLKPEVLTEALNFREGKLLTASPEAVRIARKLDSVMAPIAKKASNLGLEITNPITGVKRAFAPLENYVPHVIDPIAFKKNTDLVIEHLIDTNQMTADQAISFVGFINSGDDVGRAFLKTFQLKNVPKTYGHLEFSRLVDLPVDVLKRDKNMLQEYVVNASRRLATVENFGLGNKELGDLLQEVALVNPDAKKIEDIVQRTLGIAARDIPMEEALGALRSYQGVTKLGTAAISNLSQSVNTASVAGLQRTFANVVKEFSQGLKQRAFAVKSGALSGVESGKILEESQGPVGKILRVLGAPFFSQSEQMNRSIASNTGRDLANDLLKKFLGGDTEAGRKLADAGIDLGKYSRNTKPLFWGGGEYFPERVGQKGISLTSSESAAKEFANNFNVVTGSGKGKVTPFTITPNAKILATNDIPQEILENPGQDFGNIIKFARESGFDAVDLTGVNKIKVWDKIPEQEIRIINPKVISKARTSLTTEDTYKAARNLVTRTQFTVSPLDLPYAFTSPGGKLATQFKNFTYKQAEFVLNELLKPAMAGDFKPIIRYKTVGTAVGELTGDMKSYISGRKRPTSVEERRIENLMNVGGAGILTDAINAAQYGTEGILTWLVGPTISEVAKTGAAVSTAARTGKTKDLGRIILRDIPIIGPRLTRTVLPTATQKSEGTSPLFQLPSLKPSI